MQLKGKVGIGVLRGRDLIQIYYPRLVGTLGFEPFRGTLNIKLEKEIDITLYSSKAVEHVLMDGEKEIYAYLAPVILTVTKNSEEHNYNCWAMKEPQDPNRDVIEIIAKDNLREKFSLKDGDEIIVTFTEPPKKKRKIPGMGIIARLYGVEPQLMKT